MIVIHKAHVIQDECRTHGDLVSETYDANVAERTRGPQLPLLPVRWATGRT